MSLIKLTQNTQKVIVVVVSGGHLQRNPSRQSIKKIL